MFSTFEELVLQTCVVVLRHVARQYSSANEHRSHNAQRVLEGAESLIERINTTLERNGLAKN